MITSYFQKGRSAIIAYNILNPSGRCAYHGHSTNKGFGVVFWDPPSFNTSTISPMDSRTSLIAGHTADSVVAGCEVIVDAGKNDRFRFQLCLPFNPNAIDMDCIQSRSFGTNIITSGQNKDLEVYKVRARNHIYYGLPHFCFVVGSEDSLVNFEFQSTISFYITILRYLF